MTQKNYLVQFRSLLQGVWEDLRALDDRVCEMDQLIKRLAANNEDFVRLQQLRGVGPMISTAMVAAVALANKTARMAWAMLRNETDYDPDFAIR